jgi:uncharacterized protein YbbC (DUF1343 family)
MHKILLILITFCTVNLMACNPTRNLDVGNKKVNTKIAAIETVINSSEDVKTGAEQLQTYLPLLTNKKVALMVNQTSMVGNIHLVDTLLSIGVDIVQIFAPEHGFRGDHSAGAQVKSTRDSKTGLPITSLYGSTKKPTAEMMSNIDIVIFDIQDVGVRYYTYISSMHYLMEACAENGIKLMILDRPNPNGHYVDGPVLDINFKSFIGMHPVPLVHGMTIGEFAGMINGEGWLTSTDTCQLLVVKCSNYHHKTRYQLPVRPSPNLPTMASVYLYPSLGLFEGTNVSVGRGTDYPFELLGRPGLEPGTFEFTPKSIPGVADKPKYENVACNGILLTEFANTYILTNQRIYLEWLFLFYSSNDDVDNGDFFKSVFSKLAGTDQLRKQIEQGLSSSDIYESWQPGLDAFKPVRKKYLLYEE